MDALQQDLRYAVRRLRASPGFTLVAVLTLAVGIGANTAMFSLINALMFQRLPVRDAHRMVNVYRASRAGPLAYQFYPDFEELAASTRTLEDVLGYRPVRFGTTTPAGTRIEYGEAVTLNYFEALGVQPVLGRAFLPSDAADLGVTVISAEWWRQAYGGTPDVVGRTLRLNGRLFTVIGVAPPRFGGLNLPSMAQARFFIPVQAAGTLAVGRPGDGRSRGAVLMKGRLRPGATLEQARAEMRLFAARFEQAYPSSADSLPPRTFEVAPIGDVYIKETMDRSAIRIAAGAMAAAALVLLIACANLVNLLLARGEGRASELAVRVALGAARLRLVRMILTEHVVIAVAGGVVGLLLVAPMSLIVQAAAPPEFEGISLTIEPRLDARVVAFAGAATALTLTVLGVLPALRAARKDVAATLGGFAIASGLGRRAGLPCFLVATQVAASVLLLCLGGLFVRSAIEEARVNPGYDAKNAVMVDAEAFLNGYDQERARRFYEALLRKLPDAPELTSAGFGSALPGEGLTVVSLEDESFDLRLRDRRVAFAAITSGALEALSLPVIDGRGFNTRDMDDGPPLALVSRGTAVTLWPNQRAIGKRVRVDAVRAGSERPLVEIVGVVKDAGTRPRGRSALQIYVTLSRSQLGPPLHIFARGSRDPGTTLEAVTRIVHEVDSNFALSRRSAVYGYLAESSYPTRAAAGLLSTVGALGLVLAGIGLYGVLAYSVARRTREIGIRVSLGAGRHHVLATVLREGLVSTAAGCAAGTLLALFAGRLVSRMLFGVRPDDPLTLVTACVVLTMVSAIACYVPVRRATRVNPIVALRNL